MNSSSKLTEPPKNVIEGISNSLILAIAEANRGNSRLRCPADPNLSDGMQINEQISALQLAQVVIARSLDRRIADTRRQWNALRPVNKLPVEVFSIIFHQVLAMVSIFDHYTALFNIAKVSARWQSIVDLTPSLWSYVSSTYPKAKVDLSLKKSSPYPLSVACKYEGEWLTANSKRGSRDFLQRMKSTDRPWEELILHLPTIGHLRSILKAPAPHLRKLDINSASWSSKRVNLFGGQQGVLEDVKLRHIKIKWNSGALTGLRRLQLDYRSLSFGAPSQTEIMWLLQQSPGLQYFSWCGWPDGERVSPTNRVTLPHLTGLSLELLKGPVLLDLIHAPSCRQFRLFYKSDAVDGHVLLPPLLRRYLPCFRNSLQKAAAISICIGRSSFHFHCIPHSSDSSILFDFSSVSIEPYPMLEWFCQQLHDININTPPITIRFENRSDFTRDTALPSLFRLCNVVSLKLGDRLVGPGWLLRGLSKPNESEGNSEWPFPELAELEIAPSDLVFRDVLDFVRRRYVEKLPQDSPKRPPMLKNLRLVGKEWKEEDEDGEEEWDSDEYELERVLPGTVYSLERRASGQKECKINREYPYTWDEESHCGTSSPVSSEATDLEDDSDVE
ncbi:hypothetical protein FRC01_003910 [Tulasnella sp. 417]|nr:hypothetical protein FRC01_003910 [Tulasnella sp. 417]